MNGKQDFYHLHVEAGPDRNRRFTIPPGGSRVGRSSGNDIVLTDPSLSRFHCRLFFKPDGTLWLNDLGSTNASLINGKPVADRPLRSGDILEFGETRILIANDRPEPTPGVPNNATPPKLDLGLSRGSETPPRDEPGSQSKPSIVLVIIAIAVIAVAAVFWMAPRKNSPLSARPSAAASTIQPKEDAFDFLYEREEGNTNNLFRYVLTLRDNTLSARIDDAAGGRHVLREKKLAPEVMRGLMDDLAKSAFFDMRPEYSGVPQEGEWEARELALTLGRRSHRVRILNRMDPEEFKTIRETLENFAQNELLLASLALPPERLQELAQQSYQLAHKYLDERDVRPDNLYNAIKTFEACQWYLETVDPKPAFYQDAAAAADQARKDLAREYEARLFEADKAWQLSDWPQAAEKYRQILALIPDRSDDRHQNALKKQIDVERRIRR